MYSDYVAGSGQASYHLLAAPVSLGTAFTSGPPRVLFEGAFAGQSLTRGYDVSADARRFLFAQLKDAPGVAIMHIELVQNWTEELKARVPVT